MTGSRTLAELPRSPERTRLYRAARMGESFHPRLRRTGPWPLGGEMKHKAPAPRREMPDPHLSATEFKARFRAQFADPAFEARHGARPHNRRRLGRLRHRPQVAAHPQGRPGVRRSRLRSRRRLARGTRRRSTPRRRVTTTQRAARASCSINGSSRSEHTCPGEMSKSYRLVRDRARRCSPASRTSRSRCSTSAAWPPNTAATSIPARPASRRRRRSATGRAPATRTIRSARRRTG